MSANPDPEQMAALISTALANISQSLEPIHEAVEGYRARLVRDGYSDNLARQMAAEYHGALLRMILP